MYERASSAADKTAVVLGKEPGTAAELLARLALEWGFDADVASMVREQAGRFTWDLYKAEVQGLSIDLALVGQGDSACYVLLISEPKERRWLVDKVFWPTVKALAPID